MLTLSESIRSDYNTRRRNIIRSDVFRHWKNSTFRIISSALTECSIWLKHWKSIRSDRFPFNLWSLQSDRLTTDTDCARCEQQLHWSYWRWAPGRSTQGQSSKSRVLSEGVSDDGVLLIRHWPSWSSIVMTSDATARNIWQRRWKSIRSDRFPFNLSLLQSDRLTTDPDCARCEQQSHGSYWRWAPGRSTQGQSSETKVFSEDVSDNGVLLVRHWPSWSSIIMTSDAMAYNIWQRLWKSIR